MDTYREVLRALDDALSLGGRTSTFTPETLLLGALPELDSMAVVAVIAALEDSLGISIGDDEISGDAFESVGSLVDFVTAQLSSRAARQT